MLNLLAQAEAADREADAIFSKIEAARVPDRFGESLLTPTGFETDAERASNLRRRARHFRAEAAEVEALPAPVVPPLSPARAPVTVARTAPAAKPVPPLETADTVASRILNSDSVAPGTRLVTSAPKQPGAADTVDAIVARILSA